MQSWSIHLGCPHTNLPSKPDRTHQCLLKLDLTRFCNKWHFPQKVKHNVPQNSFVWIAHCSAPEGHYWPAGRAPQTLLSHGADQQVDPAAAEQAGAASAPPCRPVVQTLQGGNNASYLRRGSMQGSRLRDG